MSTAPHTKASQLLQNLHELLKEEPISLRDFVTLLGDRSFALAILIFSLPNSLPLPSFPGFSTITGIPILVIALQIAWGKQNIWLPERIARKEISQGIVSTIIGKSIPYVQKLEKLLHPRLSVLYSTGGERLIGLLIALMSLILCLPIVGGNFLPGLSISLLAIALLERDGLFALLSMAFCLTTIALMYSLIEWAFVTAYHWIAL